MISAEEMRNLVSSSSTKLSELEGKMKDRAQKDGKFYLEIYSGKVGSRDADSVFISLYSSNDLLTLEKNKYTLALDAEDMSNAHLYVGWAGCDAKKLLHLIKMDK